MRRITLLLALSLQASDCLLRGQLATIPAPPVSRIGVLTDLTWKDPNASAFLSSFRQGLRELGYTEGRNIHLEMRIADRDPKRLSDAAVELARSTDILVTSSSSAGKAAHEATATVPIVGWGSDSVMTGNMTGFSGVAEGQKTFLAQLKTTVPGLNRVALLFDRSYYPVPVLIRSTDEAARSLGLAVVHAEVHGASELADAFAAMKLEGAQAVLVLNHPMFRSEPETVAGLAIAYKLPLSSPYHEAGKAGALMAHEQDFDWIGRHVAAYTDKILKGTRPEDLPVDRSVPFLLFINMRTARAIGVTMPESLLSQATEVFGRD